MRSEGQITKERVHWITCVHMVVKWKRLRKVVAMWSEGKIRKKGSWKNMFSCCFQMEAVKNSSCVVKWRKDCERNGAWNILFPMVFKWARLRKSSCDVKWRKCLEVKGAWHCSEGKIGQERVHGICCFLWCQMKSVNKAKVVAMWIERKIGEQLVHGICWFPLVSNGRG